HHTRDAGTGRVPPRRRGAGRRAVPPRARLRNGRGPRPQGLLFAREDTNERAPAVVFVHGGGWAGGSPFMHLKHAAQLAADGYVAAAIWYRFVPEVPTIVGCLEDAKCAVRWMRANAESFGADPNRIAAAGGSAGGQLSAMLALTPGRYEG